MSGKKKRRIAIARVVLKSPEILLLDDATGALESESERIAQEALDLASVGRTAVVFAHRLSTVRHADVIAVVQDGRVMGIGSYDDHIARPDDGLYSSILRQQTAASPPPASTALAAPSRRRRGKITPRTALRSRSHQCSPSGGCCAELCSINFLKRAEMIAHI